jgi:hypothetical protein
VTAAAGDNGSNDGERGNHCDYPASSPHVLGCGGTSLHVNGANISETVWNDGAQGGATGGGFSSLFPLPSWQTNAAASRGVPDVAGVADPETGYVVDVDGQQMVIGGTSAVAPLWAALVARLNQALGKRLGFINPTLYALAGVFRDIVNGTNGAFSARPGWDACTGLGVPIGNKLLASLKGGAPTPPAPTPTPPPTPPTPTPPAPPVPTPTPVPTPSPGQSTLVITGTISSIAINGKSVPFPSTAGVSLMQGFLPTLNKVLTAIENAASAAGIHVTPTQAIKIAVDVEQAVVAGKPWQTVVGIAATDLGITIQPPPA